TMLTQRGSGVIEPPNISEFKNIISRALIFKAIYKTIRREFPAFQANITAYTVSITSKLVGDNISFDEVWRNQGVSSELHDQMYLWSQEVSAGLNGSARGRMISEWAKKSECWDYISSLDFSAPNPNIPELKLH
ncbi:MAG: AIPR family protein, partial [Gammaproteobacteria bacterium]|nr:AIPR family protein [Gammaproteobacteria bacterium]